MKKEYYRPEVRRPYANKIRVNDEPRYKRAHIKCYNCNEEGHYVGQCKKPKKKSDRCTKYGHDTMDCKDEVDCSVALNVNCSTPKASQGRYYLNCELNGHKITGLLDTGCSAVLLRC
ncbi:Zinc knuckle [Popillia japonica]|uniref:Zinc knuckle n=1 Tax=Popillia japonica TaxID=7064 RepID=A0AAW1KE91_POPJA